MKVAVISDIHSNLIALRLALEDLQEQKIDRVFYLGDYITDGEDGNEVLQLVRQTADCAILGNREKYLLSFSPERSEFKNYKTIATTYRDLDTDSFEYLNTLRDFEILTINGLRVLLVHGEGKDYLRENIDDTLDSFIEQYDFDICLFGHSHLYYNRWYRNRLFLNPGSIGQPADGADYKYCILHIGNEIKGERRSFKIADTFEAFEKQYKQSDYFKENPEWATIYLDCLKDGKDYFSPFITVLNKALEGIETLNADAFNVIWDKAYLEYKNKHESS